MMRSQKQYRTDVGHGLGKRIKRISFLVMFAVIIFYLYSCATRSIPLPKEDITVPPGPKGAMELYYNAKVAFKVGQFKDALKYYQKLVSEYSGVEEDKIYGPARAEAHVAIGDCLFELGHFQEAIEVYQKAANVYPMGSAHFAPLMKIGNCYMKLVKHKEALEAYLRFKSIYPGFRQLEIDHKIKEAKNALNKS